jgi:hypothetical protein
MRTMKAWRCAYGGYEETCYAATASKARYNRLLMLGDCCPDITFAEINVTRASAHDLHLPDEHELVAQLSHEERHRVLHAYGFNARPRAPRDWGYRDHYCTDAGCPIMARMTALGVFRGPCGVDASGNTPGWVGAFWYLTDLGKLVARSMIPLYGERIAAPSGRLPERQSEGATKESL